MTSDPSPLRHCNKCGNDWPPTLEYFFADSRRKGSGFRSPCKQCIKEYRIENKEQLQASRKKFYAEHAEEIKQYVRAYETEHRQEINAYRRQQYALHREEQLQRNREYRASHPEAIREYARRSRIRHREKHRQYARKLYALHPERFRQKSRQRYALHREKWRQYGRQYHHLHRNRRIQYAHQYDVTHKEERRQYNAQHREERRIGVHRYRARKRAIPGILTSTQIQEKLKQQHYRCYYAACGHAKFKKEKGKYIYHIEHTVPVSRTMAGPRHDINFVVLSCEICNKSKGKRLPHEWPEGGRLL